MSHTPLPWRITEPNEKKTREIVGANGETVARLTALDMENAALIVASVNAASALTDCRHCGFKVALNVKPEPIDWAAQPATIYLTGGTCYTVRADATPQGECE